MKANWGEPAYCPFCRRAFRWIRISKDQQQHYPKGQTHYSSVISIYERGRDRTTAWLCPFCKYQWPR